MYAIISTGGKQYRVENDQVLRVELLKAEAGEKVSFDVLLLNKDGEVVVGNPTVAGAKVEAEVVKHGRGAKIDIFKYKAKKNERKRQGHRQPYTEVKVTSING